jgi:sulfotransferase
MDMHFISGLPRSGSTLLASLLRQVPGFHSSIMSPTGRMLTSMVDGMGVDNEAANFISDTTKKRVLRGIFADFYVDKKADMVFDNNRRWCANIDLLASLFPSCKVICCVRSPAAIVDSFERLHRSHPLGVSVIYGGRSNLTVYDRVAEVMKPSSVLGYALNSFRDAYFGPQRERMLIINYDDLCQFPQQIMSELHTSLGVPQFNYNVEKIEPIPGAAEFDAARGAIGLHDLKPRVVYETRTTVLPPDIYNNLPPAFWRVKEEATAAK